MKLFDAVAMALKNLWKRKLRTLLTMSAVVIGAFLITIVFSLVAGIEKFFELQFETFSDPTFIEVQAEKFDFSSLISMSGLGGDTPAEVTQSDPTSLMSMMPKPFKDEDIEKIKEVDNVEYAEDLIVSINTVWINYKGAEKNYQITLYSYPKFAQEKVTLVAGRYVEDGETGKIVLANQYAEVFGVSPEEMIGKTVNVNVAQSAGGLGGGCTLESPLDKLEQKVYQFEIVGVTEKTILSTLGMISTDQAKEIQKFSRCTDEVLTDNDKARIIVWVKVDSVENVPAVEKALEGYGFDARTYSEEKDQMGQLFDILKYFLSAFGIIAMVVASLSIVNTLFMAIYERTREIGIMKAVGASSLHILFMFTVEASMIGLIGGVIGVAVGFGVSHLVDIVLHGGFEFLGDSVAILQAYESLDISVFSADMVMIPVLSMIVAIIAGLFPAYKASKLDPVVALRYE